MLATIEGEGRRLYDRGPGALGLVVDNDGVSLGSRYPLVERRAGSYCVIERDAAGVLLRTVFDYDDDPAPFVGLCHGIAKALDAGNLLRAQLLGLQMPMGALSPHHLGRLDRLAAMLKADYNPDEARNAAGEWGYGPGTTVASMAATGAAASWDLLAEGAATAAETVGAGLGALAAPVLLAGGLLIPSSHSAVHEGDVIGHPDLTYHFDEGILTLFHTDPNGVRTDVFHGFPHDGEYRNEAGQLIGRLLPEGFDLAPEFLNAMGASVPQMRTKTDAEVIANDRPEICPDPTPALEFMSARSIAYQTQITGLPAGLVVRYNGVKYDGCNFLNGHFEEAKAAGFQKFMLDLDNWRDWFRGDDGIEAQMIRQSERAGGHHVDWYFAEKPVADYFRRRAEDMKLSNLSVYYVPPVIQ